MAESLNYNLANVLANQEKWVQGKYNSEEIAEKNMLDRELQNAQQALDSQRTFLGLTLKEKVDELKIPARVVEELKDVALKTLAVPLEPFMKWLEENEAYYTENMFTELIQSDAKQLNQTYYHLTKETANTEVGKQFQMKM